MAGSWKLVVPEVHRLSASNWKICTAPPSFFVWHLPGSIVGCCGNWSIIISFQAGYDLERFAKLGVVDLDAIVEVDLDLCGG